MNRGMAGRIVAPMDWADYLIWRTGGAVEPMVYSHVHLSGPNFGRIFSTSNRASPAGWNWPTATAAVPGRQPRPSAGPASAIAGNRGAACAMKTGRRCWWRSFPRRPADSSASRRTAVVAGGDGLAAAGVAGGSRSTSATGLRWGLYG